MQYYKSFNTEAMELSRLLPEEESELYKRHFIPIPLEDFAKRFSLNEKDRNEQTAIAAVADAIHQNFNLSFDLVFGSADHRINGQDEFIKVIDSEKLTEENIRGKAYTNKDGKLVSFIHAYSKKVVYVQIPEGKSVDINVLFVNNDAPLCTQVLIKVGKGAKLNLFEWHASKTKAKSMSGVLHEIVLDQYAKAEVDMLHNEDENTYVVGFSKGKIGDNGELRINYIYNGGINTRSKNEIDSSGHAARSTINEIVIGSAGQKFDLNTVIANVDADTVSDLESRAALMDKSVCILKGFADVGENAKRSLSFVNERGILLDKTAYMSSIPGMSIKNSDVKATHSSATAPIDTDSLFYLMSRGSDETSAKKLLVSGFFSGNIAKIDSPVVKSIVASLIHEKINNRTFGTVPKLNTVGVWFDTSADASDIFQGHYKYRNVKQ